MDKQVEVECVSCGKKFMRRKAEVNRSQRMGRQSYCSLQCCGEENWKHLTQYDNNKCLDENRKLGARVDEYSPFRFFMKCMKNKRTKHPRKPCFVTLQDLKEQWDKQQGICPYTGWKMKTPTATSSYYSLPRSPDRASIDRIDSAIPYVVGNIQFVSLMAQYAKNAWSGDELIRFCDAVTSNQMRIDEQCK